MTSEELLIEQRGMEAFRAHKEAACNHKWRVVSEFIKDTRKEVLVSCDSCGGIKTMILDC